MKTQDARVRWSSISAKTDPNSIEPPEVGTAGEMTVQAIEELATNTSTSIDNSVQYTAQSKTIQEKNIARSNIDSAKDGGAFGSLKNAEDDISNRVRYDTDQNLDNTEKAQGRSNLDVFSKDETLQLVDVFTTKTATLTENGKGIKADGTLENVGACVTKEYDVAGAQQVRINGIAPINHALYVFLDANSNPILPAGEVNNTNAQKSYVAFDVIKPINAERVLVCGTLNFGSVCITLTEKYALKSDLDNSVQYTAQSKTDAKKLQARTNINAQENLSTITLTELNRNYTENGFLLLTDGTTIGATGYHVYSFNVNGKTKVAVDGVSIVNAVVDYCLACVYNQAGTLLQAFFIETNQTYTQQEITLPVGSYKIKVAGSSAVTARCYEVVQGYPFYTKPESDNTFVKQDGNKVLSDNNFTNALLTKLNAAITQIKTINNTSLLGTGNINIQGGGGGGITTEENYKYFEDVKFWQTEIPTGAVNGDIWYNPTTNELKSFGGGIWDDLGEKSYYIFKYGFDRFVYDGVLLQPFGVTENQINGLIQTAISSLNIFQEDEILGMIEPAYDILVLDYYQPTFDIALAETGKYWYDSSTDVLKKFTDNSGTYIEIALEARKLYMFNGTVYTVINNKLAQLPSRSEIEIMKKQIKLAL